MSIEKKIVPIYEAIPGMEELHDHYERCMNIAGSFEQEMEHLEKIKEIIETEIEKRELSKNKNLGKDFEILILKYHKIEDKLIEIEKKLNSFNRYLINLVHYKENIRP